MENKYSRLQISIHWLVFLLVIVAYCAMEFRGFFPRKIPFFFWKVRLEAQSLRSIFFV